MLYSLTVNEVAPATYQHTWWYKGGAHEAIPPPSMSVNQITPNQANKKKETTEKVERKTKGDQDQEELGSARKGVQHSEPARKILWQRQAPPTS